MLEVQNLRVQYGDYTVVNDVSFSVPEGAFYIIAGPNGAGKSTILAAISQSIPYQGSVVVMGDDAKALKSGQLARRIGFLMQNHFVGYDFTVEEIVRLGRYAYGKGPLYAADSEDEAQVERALEMTGMGPFRRQSALTLSGGELQRAFLAQALCQDPGVLLLDEPTNHLDPGYQKETFELIDAWRKTPGRAVAAVVHDLSLAKAFGSHALLLHRGRRVFAGETERALSRENLETVYGMDVQQWLKTLLSQWED